MSPSAKPFQLTQRRRRNLLLMLVAIGGIAALIETQLANLIHSNFTSGYLLLGCLLFLTAFNLRKKLPMLPRIGSATAWMQWHIYVGLSTFAIFGFHVAWRIPNGWFELLLTWLYLIVAFSGVYGLYVTRVLPSRLNALPEEVIFERIPLFRRQLALQARKIVLEAGESSDLLARFYANRLAKFFEQPRSLVYLISPNGRLRRQVIAEIDDLDRFLTAEQRPTSRKLAALVNQKDDLDYHQAIQGRLKLWLFVHVGFTYSLLIVSLWHAVLVHRFGGGF